MFLFEKHIQSTRDHTAQKQGFWNMCWWHLVDSHSASFPMLSKPEGVKKPDLLKSAWLFEHSMDQRTPKPGCKTKPQSNSEATDEMWTWHAGCFGLPKLTAFKLQRLAKECYGYLVYQSIMILTVHVPVRQTIAPVMLWTKKQGWLKNNISKFE